MSQSESTARAQGILRDSPLFAPLPENVLVGLAASSNEIRLVARELVYSQGDAERQLVIIDGIIRLFISAPSEGEATVLYLRQRDVFGLFSLGDTRPAINAQALLDTPALELPPGAMQRLAAMFVPFAQGLAHELVRRWEVTLAMLGMNTFGTVRQRLIQHLLILARPAPSVNELVAPVTHQELADAVGTTRDVVSRVLRELRDELSVRLLRGAVVILDPRRLEDEIIERFPNETKVLLPQPAPA